MKCVQIAGPKRLEVTNIKPPVEHDGYVICELRKQVYVVLTFTISLVVNLKV